MQYEQKSWQATPEAIKALAKVRKAKRYLSDSHTIREVLIEAAAILKKQPREAS